MASVTTGLTQLMQIFYDKTFLDRAKKMLVFEQDAQIRRLPANNGKTVYFNRFTPLAVATTALTEATNPSGSDMTASIVSTTVAEYGDFVKVGSLFDLTSIDEGLKEHTAVMGQQAGETIDTLIVKELSGGATAQLAAAALTAIAATDTLTGAQIRKAVRTLKANSAMRFEDGYYHGIVQPFTSYDLFANSEWLDAQRYTNPELIKQGYIGALHGVLFKESNNSTSESSTVTVYHTYVYGKNAYGVVDIASSSAPKMIVKNPGEQDTSNPLNMFSTIGWRITFACKVLNANWIINIKTGATA